LFRVIDTVRDRLIFLLMRRCGLRVSEVSHVTWEDIDVHARTIRITKSQGQVDRVVYVAPEVEPPFRLWHTRRSTSQYMFPGRGKQSTPLSRKHIFWWMKKYLPWAELPPHYSPHGLRQSLRYPPAQCRRVARGAERVDGPPLDPHPMAIHQALRRDNTTPV
jgi:integrase